jgi:hypothetical protein
MSEERLSPELDGTGGGYGKHKGMTVREMSQQFDQIASDGTMRSFTACLRISREQIEARGGLHVGMYTAIIFPILTAVIFAIALTTGDKNLGPLLIKIGLMMVAFTGAFIFGYLRTRPTANAAAAQERAIRDLTVDTLVRIASEPGFKPKPLEFSLHLYLTRLLKTTKRNEPELIAVLEQGEA